MAGAWNSIHRLQKLISLIFRQIWLFFQSQPSKDIAKPIPRGSEHWCYWPCQGHPSTIDRSSSTHCSRWRSRIFCRAASTYQPVCTFARRLWTICTVFYKLVRNQDSELTLSAGWTTMGDWEHNRTDHVEHLAKASWRGWKYRVWPPMARCEGWRQV